jgi:hypothetical protein
VEKIMVFKKRKIIMWHLFGLCLLANCQMAIAQAAPAWVVDYKKVYPESDWICVVESGGNRQQAQAAASTALAGVFKINVQSLTTATQIFSKTMSNGESQLSQNDDFNRQVNTTTDITGLMGVLTDFWTDPKNGTVYTSARMNKREGAVTYSNIITENDKAIAMLKKDAADKPATFDAYESLNVAASLAAMTDNYLAILSVLNSATRQALSVSYGNSTAVETLRQQAARSIVVTVTVTGDVDNRISKAFGTVFSDRGFRTQSGSGDNPYVLEADFEIEELDLKTGGNSFVRYVLNGALLDSEGTEIFSFSENKRDTHRLMSEAKQRAVRSAESAITAQGFAVAFDNHLSSLLK